MNSEKYKVSPQSETKFAKDTEVL